MCGWAGVEKPVKPKCDDVVVGLAPPVVAVECVVRDTRHDNR